MEKVVQKGHAEEARMQDSPLLYPAQERGEKTDLKSIMLKRAIKYSINTSDFFSIPLSLQKDAFRIPEDCNSDGDARSGASFILSMTALLAYTNKGGVAYTNNRHIDRSSTLSFIM